MEQVEYRAVGRNHAVFAENEDICWRMRNLPEWIVGAFLSDLLAKIAIHSLSTIGNLEEETFSAVQSVVLNAHFLGGSTSNLAGLALSVDKLDLHVKRNRLCLSGMDSDATTVALERVMANARNRRAFDLGGRSRHEPVKASITNAVNSGAVRSRQDPWLQIHLAFFANMWNMLGERTPSMWTRQDQVCIDLYNELGDT